MFRILFAIHKRCNYKRYRTDKHKHEYDHNRYKIAATLHHSVNMVEMFFYHYKSVIDIIAERRGRKNYRNDRSKLPFALQNGKDTGKRTQQH